MAAGRTTGKKNLHSKKKGYKRSHATKSRSRDIDQIQVRTSIGAAKSSDGEERTSH